MISWLRQIFPTHGLKSRSPLTLYVLSNEGVIHYVTVICFQYFLKFSNVIVLVSTGRKKQTMLKLHREHDPVTHTETVKHRNIEGSLQTIPRDLGLKLHYQAWITVNVLSVLTLLLHVHAVTMLQEIKDTYLTKFVIARISGSFLYGLAFKQGEIITVNYYRNYYKENVNEEPITDIWFILWLLPPESQKGLFLISSTCWPRPSTSGTWFVSGFQTRRSFWRPQRSPCELSRTPPLLNASFHHTLTQGKEAQWARAAGHIHILHVFYGLQRCATLPLITPIISGWGMADLMWSDCSYRAFNFLLFFCAVYIWISRA